MTAPTHRLNVPVIDAEDRGYVYVAHGADCVLLCEKDVPKWRNALALTPDAARHLAVVLIEMAAAADRTQAESDEGDAA